MSQGAGLRGVTAAETRLSRVNGEQGTLEYCGYAIEDLANHVSFEECIALLWDKELPTRQRLDELTARLRAEARLDPAVLESIAGFPKTANPMAALRTAISTLALHDAEADDDSPEANERKATRLVAQTPLCVGAFARHREGLPPAEWRNDLNFAGNVLYQLLNVEPSPEAIDVMDKALVLHADHGFNASTFAFRVTVGTLSDMYSGATTAIGTLKGPLHGGANERVMKMLMAIGELDKVEPHIRGMLDRKEKVMGFGHAVYQVLDPRARVLDESAARLAGTLNDRKWFDMSRRIQELMHEAKGLNANVDFFTAATYHSLDIPTDLFTPIFAISRMSGWCAHGLEQLANNKLIRPKAGYVGAEARAFVPMAERG